MFPNKLYFRSKPFPVNIQKKYWNYPKSKIPLLWLIRGVGTKVSDIQHQLTWTKFNKRGGENSFLGENYCVTSNGFCVIWTQADVGGRRVLDKVRRLALNLRLHFVWKTCDSLHVYTF